MSEHIKRLNRELKFKGKIIDFYQDTMEIDGDHTVVWDFIKHKGAATVVPVTEDGKILMVRQYRMRWNAIRWRFRQARLTRKTSRDLPARPANWRRRPGIGASISNG